MFITSALRKEFGGPPVAVVGASTSLADLGNEVTVMVFGQTSQSIKENQSFYSELEMHNVSVLVAKARRTSIYGGSGNLKDLGKLISEIRKSEILSTHAIYNFQNILIYTITSMIRKPLIVMPHGTLTRYQSRIHKYRKLVVNLFFVNLFVRHVDAILVATEIEKNELDARLQEKSRVVGLGLRLIEDLEMKSDVENTDKKFLFLGRIAPVKRLDVAIEAFAYFVNRMNRNYRLIVCGSGNSEYVRSMVSLAADRDVLDLVEFRGWVDSNEKARVFSECSWLMMTSENENFAMTVAESLAHGIPCIVSKNVALSSVVSNHGAGIVFQTLDPVEIADAMCALVTKDQHEMRSAAFKAGQHFQWDNVARNWNESFEYVIKHRKINV